MIYRSIRVSSIRYSLQSLLQLGYECVFPVLEVALQNMLTRLRHETKIERQVMQAQNGESKTFFDLNEMTDVGTRIVVIHIASAVRV